ncbi:MAG: hypothetical protein Q9202_004705 [Teloschistes flavicans]
MLTPILYWSTEIRKHGRTVAVCWGTLMFAALVPTLLKTSRGVYSVSNYDQYVTCSVDAAKGCTSEDFEGLAEASLLSDYYNLCNCTDSCGALSLPDFPFRRGQSLQAYLISKRTWILLRSSYVNGANFVNTLFLGFIMVHGTLGLLEVKFTQAEVRNKMTRYFIAKAIACLWYITAWVVAIISPMWSSYVSALFVLLAAIIQRYLPYGLKLLKRVLRRQPRTVDSKTAREGEEEIKAVSVSRGLRRVKEEWKDFRLWWQHPVFRSRQPHYKLLQSSPELQSFPASSSQCQLLATTPPLFPTLAPQNPGPSPTVISPYLVTPTGPQLPSTIGINPPSPDATAPGYFDRKEAAHETVQRPSFEREASGAWRDPDERFEENGQFKSV